MQKMEKIALQLGCNSYLYQQGLEKTAFGEEILAKLQELWKSEQVQKLWSDPKARAAILGGVGGLGGAGLGGLLGGRRGALLGGLGGAGLGVAGGIYTPEIMAYLKEHFGKQAPQVPNEQEVALNNAAASGRGRASKPESFISPEAKPGPDAGWGAKPKGERFVARQEKNKKNTEARMAAQAKEENDKVNSRVAQGDNPSTATGNSVNQEAARGLK